MEADEDYTLVGEGFVYDLMHGEGLLKARKTADPSYNGQNADWLGRLHKEELPFTMGYVVIK